MNLYQGFPDHPHRGQATVTYMLEGSSRHEDSAGHKGTIVAGGVQWMCAVSLLLVWVKLSSYANDTSVLREKEVSIC